MQIYLLLHPITGSVNDSSPFTMLARKILSSVLPYERACYRMSTTSSATNHYLTELLSVYNPFIVSAHLLHSVAVSPAI